jgi:hypothetical protein
MRILNVRIRARIRILPEPYIDKMAGDEEVFRAEPQMVKLGISLI